MSNGKKISVLRNRKWLVYANYKAASSKWNNQKNNFYIVIKKHDSCKKVKNIRKNYKFAIDNQEIS